MRAQDRDDLIDWMQFPKLTVIDWGAEASGYLTPGSCRLLLAEIERHGYRIETESLPMIDWKPIETAPKDEQWVLLFFETSEPTADPAYKVGFWSKQYHDWYEWEGASHSLTEFEQPTHWAALQPPAEARGANAKK